MLIDPAQMSRLCRARAVLAEDDELPISRVAKLTGISRFHFIRQFAALFGETPHQYRTRARVERAKQLLANGRSVTDTCMEVGSFETDDIESEYVRLSKHGVAFTKKPTNVGPVTIALFADTCGNLIQLHQPT